MDGALYAPLLPVLQVYGEEFDLIQTGKVDSMAFSFYKFLGVPFVSGMALTREELVSELHQSRS
jgi:glutamate/tyrosine decarboxylase-like PLP-dependent enzyme